MYELQGNERPVFFIGYASENTEQLRFSESLIETKIPLLINKFALVFTQFLLQILRNYAHTMPQKCLKGHEK